MTSSKWLPVLTALCSLFFPLRGQTNDWRSIEQLAPGTSISVVAGLRQGCELVRITDWELICDQEKFDRERRRAFPRHLVREVRLEDAERNRMIAGAIIGGVIGGLVGFLAGGQASDPEARGYLRFYGIPVGAAMGGAIGSHFHRHGAVIYRQR